MLSHYIGFSDLNRVLEKLLDRSEIYAPIRSGDFLNLENISKPLIEKIVYDTARQVDPQKTLLFPARTIAARYFRGEASHSKKALTMVGVKSCDAKALQVYDRVMLEGGFVDLDYRTKREKLLLIGSDCQSIWPTCFCSLVGVDPYPESGVDINLSPVESGFAVDVISQKGREFFEEFAYFFRDATPEEIDDTRSARNRTLRLLAESNKPYSYKLPVHEIIKGTLDSPAWRKITKFCTECGACNIACPSCTCFSFYDQSAQKEHERVRLWDACLKGSYAKVAGGANTRPVLSERYNNRLQCKFDYSYERLKTYTCTGCGRCIECCPAKIDMREAIKELERSLALASIKLE